MKHEADTATSRPARNCDRDDGVHEMTRVERILATSESLLDDFEHGRAVHKRRLQKAMRDADPTGDWTWRDAYDAVEAAQVRLLGRYGGALLRQAGRDNGAERAEWTEAILDLLLRIEELEPKQTERSAEQTERQQFSTPLPLAWCAVAAADIQQDDTVLEPSAGTGIMAVMAAWMLHGRGKLALNEIGATRHELLEALFPTRPATRRNAEQVTTELPGLQPDIIVMNPPASRAAAERRTKRHMDTMHTAAAYRALTKGGRLVTITSDSADPEGDNWATAFEDVTPAPHVLTSERVSGALFEKRGTRDNARITVIEKPMNAAGPTRLQARDNTVHNDPKTLLASLVDATPVRTQPSH